MRRLGQDDLVLCSGTVRHLDLPETAEVAAAAGYQGVSVYLHEVRAARRDGWTLAALRRMLDDLDLGVAEIDGQVGWLPGEPSSDKAASVDEALEVAAGLGARSLTALEINGHRVGVDLDMAFAADAFAELCDRAASQQLLVHIEYFPFSGIADLHTALAVAREANRPNGGVMVDVWHHTRGADHGDADVLVAAAPMVHGVQLNDALPEAADDVRHECMHGRVMPGAGLARSGPIVAALRRGGCTAPFGVEVFSDELDELDAVDAARRARDATRKVLRAHL
jgi:sugar phosphate isomerase/epimerase